MHRIARKFLALLMETRRGETVKLLLVSLMAVEFLDNLIDSDLKRPLMPIIDHSTLHDKVNQAQALFDLKELSRKDALSALLDDDDIWLRVCAIYRLAKEGVTDFDDKIRTYLKSKESLLRQTAQRYFQILDRKDKLTPVNANH